MDVVFHVPSQDPVIHRNTLGNIENLIDDQTTDIDKVVLVVNGGGLEMLVVQNQYADRVRNLLDENVQVVACQNTLHTADRDPDSLVEGTEIVPSAMGELVRLQTEGYAYIRPG